MRFNTRDPYPLFEPGALSYAEDQEHAAAVDQWLGLETERIETALVKNPRPRLPHLRSHGDDQQLWIGLPVQTLLTPYTELRAMLARLAPLAGQTVVDLGAGYGRMGFVIARHHPGVRFVGYEYVPERVAEGARCLAAAGAGVTEGIELLRADLSDAKFSPISAEYYFIYDYGTRPAIDKTLADLREIARTRPITVIGRGRSSRDAIEHGQPWLSQVVAPQHMGHYSIYRSG